MAADRERRTILPFPARKEGPASRTAPEILTFEEALAAHLDGLYATAVRLTRDPCLAEDLVQDAVLRAYRSFRDLRSRERFRSWLFTILVNTAKNQARDSTRRVPFVDVDLDTLLEDPLLADRGAASPESILLRECLPEDLEDGLEALPEPRRRSGLRRDARAGGSGAPLNRRSSGVSFFQGRGGSAHAVGRETGRLDSRFLSLRVIHQR